MEIRFPTKQLTDDKSQAGGLIFSKSSYNMVNKDSSYRETPLGGSESGQTAWKMDFSLGCQSCNKSVKL